MDARKEELFTLHYCSLCLFSLLPLSSVPGYLITYISNAHAHILRLVFFESHNVYLFELVTHATHKKVGSMHCWE